MFSRACIAGIDDSGLVIVRITLSANKPSMRLSVPMWIPCIALLNLMYSARGSKIGEKMIGDSGQP